MGNRSVKFERDVILVEGGLGSGKTSLLSKLKSGAELWKYDSNRETVDFKGETLNVWDLHGRDRSRPLFIWNSSQMKAVVYVIDSSDREGLDDSLDDLVEYFLLEKYGTSGMVVLVLANKQDLTGALTALEIQDALKRKYKFSSTFGSGHTVLVRPCSVETMEGVDEAFGEFVEQMRLKQEKKSKPGLIPLAGDPNDANVKDVDLDTQQQKESIARAKVKSFLKNPFCLFRAMD